MAKQIHVTPRPDGKWQVIRANAAKASNVTETQAEAINIAKEYSKKDGAGITISGRHGKFRKK